VLEISTTPVPVAHPGDKVTMYVVVHADKATAHQAKLTLSAKPTASTTPGASYSLGDLTTANKIVAVTVTIPTTMKPGKLVVTAKITAKTSDKAVPRSVNRTITITAAPAVTTTASATPSLPTTSTGVAAGAYTPPSPAGSIQPAAAPSIALPQIASATPSTATASGLNMTAMREGTSDSQELTFQRVASTQAAWLAALLVVFSVLLTQVRLVGARSARSQTKGDHRRNRRGMFGS
jgi:hypothetical protein